MRILNRKGGEVMDIHSLSSLEKLIFKLTYCKGIGISGKWKIVAFSEKTGKSLFTVDEMIRIAGIQKHQDNFRESWSRIDSKWLDEQIKEQQFITWRSSKYPKEFEHLYQAPLILFYLGDIDLLKKNKLAVVGARDASVYAGQILHKFIPQIVARQFVLISGLARGVDQYTHEMTIRAGGKTIGVIGCGLDTCYPREVGYLFIEMSKKHLILSEYPKGTPILRHHFPMRNRIIAGLSMGTCVIEAKERSGSLITAQLALEYGREVFAIPGDIINERSNGCHRLIQDGAKCVYSIQDILEELPEF